MRILAMVTVVALVASAPLAQAAQQGRAELSIRTALPDQDLKRIMPKAGARPSATRKDSASIFVPQVKPAADGSIKATPAMWVVHGPKGTIYLLGSIHYLPKNVDWQTPQIVTAMKRADTFVFEIPMDEDTMTKMGEDLSKNAFLPIDLSLPSFFDQQMRDDYRDVMFRIHGDPDGLVYMRPWFAAMELQGQAEGGEKVQGLRSEEGVDRKVYAAAKARGVKHFRGLESADSHVQLLTDNGNIPEGMAALRQTIKTLKAENSDETTVQRLFDGWYRGDIKALAEAGPDNPQMTPYEHKVILEDRNRKWIPELVAMLNEKHTYFVTVGAEHLVGKIGVPTLLREKGYRVDGPDAPQMAALKLDTMKAEPPRRAPEARTEQRLSDIRADKPCSGSCSGRGAGMMSKLDPRP